MFNLKSITLLTFSVITLTCSAAFAETTMSKEGQYIFNSLAFYIGGVLVAFMAAGFCMLEGGLVRSKNATVQCTKNISLYAIAGLMYAIIGYNLMYMDVNGFIGSFSFWNPSEPSVDDGYSSGSDWFFQMVFVATAASIVSGAVAERVKLTSFLVFVVKTLI